MIVKLIIFLMLLIPSFLSGQEKLTLNRTLESLRTSSFDRKELSTLLSRINDEKLSDARLAKAVRICVDRLGNRGRKSKYRFVFRQHLPSFIARVGKLHPETIPDLLALHWPEDFSKYYLPAFENLGTIPVEVRDQVLVLAGQLSNEYQHQNLVVSHWRKIENQALELIINDWPGKRENLAWSIGVVRCLASSVSSNGRIRDRIPEFAKQIYQHSDPKVRIEFWKGFGKTARTDRQYRDQILEGLNDPNQDVVSAALTLSVSGMSQKDLNPDIINQLYRIADSSVDIPVRVKAVEILGWRGFPDHSNNNYEKPYIRFLRSPHEEIRWKAIESRWRATRGTLGAVQWSEEIFECYCDEYRQRYMQIANSRRDFRSEQCLHIVSRYACDYLNESSAKMESLYNGSPRGNRVAILSIVRQVRSNLCSVTAKLDEPARRRFSACSAAFRSIIAAALKDKDPIVRAAGLHASELQFQLESEEVINTVIRLLDDENPQVRYAAGRAFASTANVPTEAIPGLVRLLSNPPLKPNQIVFGNRLYRAATKLETSKSIRTESHGFQIPSQVAAAALSCVDGSRANPLVEILKLAGRQYRVKTISADHSFPLVDGIRMDEAIKNLTPLNLSQSRSVVAIIESCRKTIPARPSRNWAQSYESIVKVSAATKALSKSEAPVDATAALQEIIENELVSTDCKTHAAIAIGRIGEKAKSTVPTLVKRLDQLLDKQSRYNNKEGKARLEIVMTLSKIAPNDPSVQEVLARVAELDQWSGIRIRAKKFLEQKTKTNVPR